jgi:hypothetical protein
MCRALGASLEGGDGVQIDNRRAVLNPSNFAACRGYLLFTMRVPIRERKTSLMPAFCWSSRRCGGVKCSSKNKCRLTPDDVRRHRPPRRPSGSWDPAPFLAVTA